MNELAKYLTEISCDGLVSGLCQQQAAVRFDLTFAEVESAMLGLGLWPARYQRNRRTISTEGQLALLHSSVTVIGCGGLGGYIIEGLARLGVGRIIAVDPDVFEEHNLNRQVLSTMANLGLPKVTAAARRVSDINPAVSLVPVETAFSSGNAVELLEQATVAIDALDNLTARRQLAHACRELGIPLVHGAIAGWYGQVATQRRGEDISPHFMGQGDEPKGVELKLGNPAFTPAAVASLQLAEACKVILGQGETISGRMLVFNLLEMEFEAVCL
ncbi:MAG TPA: HesA/MoeB/ThiF family protein [Geomonas sp.]|nr:HesA/MoeB/ThiF family protein [Geomonas sp.]